MLPLTPPLTLGLTWGEARSRAQRLYPRSEIVDKIRELKMDLLLKPNAKRVVALTQLKGPYPNLYQQGRCLEVRVSVSTRASVCVSVSVCLSVCLSVKENVWCVCQSQGRYLACLCFCLPQERYLVCFCNFVCLSASQGRFCVFLFLCLSASQGSVSVFLRKTLRVFLSLRLSICL